MIIAISGSVGSGKSSIAKILGEKLGMKVLHLNDMTKDYEVAYVKELQTFDFDLDSLLDELEFRLEKERERGDDLIIESHFAHFVKPRYVDVLFILNRNLKDLEKEYKKRGYNAKKMADNLEVESFNLCFYEALEQGYEEEEKVFCIENSSDLKDTVKKMIEKINKLGK